MSASKSQSKQGKPEQFQAPEAIHQQPQKKSHKAHQPPLLKKRTYESDCEIQKSNWIEENIINPQLKRFKRYSEKQQTQLQSSQEKKPEITSPPEPQPSVHYSTKISDFEQDNLTQTSPDQHSQEKVLSAKKEQVNLSQEINQSSPQIDKTLTHYLNSENLKHLERITACVKMNYSKFFSKMIDDKEAEAISTALHSGQGSQKSSAAKSQVSKFLAEEIVENAAKLRVLDEKIKDLAEKKKSLEIASLQTRTEHLRKDKLSDKLGRRDIQFYDLYVKKEDATELGLLNDKGFPLDIDADQYYKELEAEDFNQVFANPSMFQERFGKSIKVTVTLSKLTKTMKRKVIENASLVRIQEDKKQVSPSMEANSSNGGPSEQVATMDPELINIHNVLKQLQKDFTKTNEEIAEIFVRVSGRLDKMKDYLQGRPVVEWNLLEDLALECPEETPQFQVLLEAKGWAEILIRREFLQAAPVLREVKELSKY